MSVLRVACRICAVVIGIAAAFELLDLGLNAMRSRLIPKNFAVVEPGVLYRSGQLRPEHLERVVREHGIRTIICLNPQEVPEEQERAAKLGIEWRPFPMPGSGQGQAKQFREVLAVIRDPASQPVLVHCAAGAYRTGATCALYRMTENGWTFDDAVREMKFFGFAGQSDLIDHVKSVLATMPACGTVLR